MGCRQGRRIRVDGQEGSGMRTRVLGISAGRKDGNTDYVVKEALKAAESCTGCETSFVNISEMRILGCVACHLCFGHEKGWGIRDAICYAHRDDLGGLARSLMEADGVVLGSPVYVFGIPSKLRALMERTSAFTANSMNEAAGLLRYKPLGAIVVAAGRRAGQDSAASEIFSWALCMGMAIVPAFPTENGLPAASIHCGSADCVEAQWYLGKEAVRKESSLMSFPLGAISALKSCQNLGRAVASYAAIMKAGLEALGREGFEPPRAARFRSFPAAPKEGSYLDHLVHEGLVALTGRHREKEGP